MIGIGLAGPSLSITAGQAAVDAAFPSPTFSANFTASTVTPLITFTRASARTYFDAQGVMQSAATNVWPVEYDPATGVCLGRSVWGARTNLLLQSGWAGGTSGTLGSGAVAPTSWVFINSGGSVTYQDSRYGTIAKSIRFTTVAGRPAIGQNVTLATSSTYTQSWRVDRVYSGLLTISECSLTGAEPVGSSASYRVNGAAVAGSYVLQTGDFCERIFVTTTTGGSVQVRFGPGASGVTTCDIELSLCQYELGAFATPYIPTTTTTVTRAADVPSVTGTNFSSWFNASEGTFVTTANSFNFASGVPYVFSASDASINNAIYLRRDASLGRAISIVGSVAQTNLVILGTPNSSFVNHGFAYKASDFSATANGAVTVTATSGALPLVDRFFIGNRFDGNGSLNGYITRITYYPKRLPDTILRGLTSV